MRAAALAGLPNRPEVLERALKGSEEPPQAAALAVVAQVGIGKLEPLVKDARLHARKNAPYPFRELYRMLSMSDDPGMAAVFRQSLAHTGEVAQSLDGTAQSRKPWLRALLLERAQQDRMERWGAFRELAAWGEETEPELVKLSVELLDKTPAQEGLERPLSLRYGSDLLPGPSFASTSNRRGSFDAQSLSMATLPG